MKMFKISIRLFIIIITILLFTQLPTFATTGKATTSSLRIRKTPSTEGEVLEVLSEGDAVEILGEQGDWYNISAKGYEGYVSKEYISTNNSTQAQNNEQQSNEQTPNEQTPNEQTSNEQTPNEQTSNNQTLSSQNSIINKAYKITEKTTINILPILNSEVIGEFNKDENVILINNAGLWAYVKTNNISGWIRIDKLSTENDAGQNNNQNANNNVVNEQKNNETNTENTNSVNNNSENENTQNNNNNTNNSETNNQQSNYTPKKMYVKSTAINIRSESNTTSNVVATITLNEEVTVIGEENGWYKVQTNGKNGYIRNDLLSDSKTEESSRSNNIDRNNVSNSVQKNENQSTDKKQEVNNTNNTNAKNTQTSNKPQTTTSTSSGVTGNDIVAYAKQFLGCRYVYGASGPNSFDCSGLTMYVYKHFGYSLSHSSRAQAKQGKAVTGALQPGDILVFSNGSGVVGHVGIYIGNDKFIHASDSTTGVIISNLSDRWNKSKYMGARRIL